MEEYISRNEALESVSGLGISISGLRTGKTALSEFTVLYRNAILQAIEAIPAADVRPVVTCQGCIHAEPFDRNCELNSTAYMHCKQGRGSEVKNVWHKYKKYYKDYSVVDRDGYCDEWADMRGGQGNG